MSLHGWSRLGWCALAALAVSLGLARESSAAPKKPAANQGAGRTAAAAPEEASLETFVKPDGQGYFALKLTPHVAQPARRPHDLVALFDTSASQTGEYRAEALAALRSMLSALDANDRVALVAVDLNGVPLTESFVPPKGAAIEQALAALERRVPLGSTDMPKALDLALETCAAHRDAARVSSVVYIGDGINVAGLLGPKELERLIAAFVTDRVSITSYAIGPRIDGLLLGSLANHTGGMLLIDGSAADGRRFGQVLAEVARGEVIWPTDAKLPDALREVYPRRAPPLRFDRDSVMVGTMDEHVINDRPKLPVAIEGEIAGRTVHLQWEVVPQKPNVDQAYLENIVETAAATDGLSLAAVGSAGLDEMRRFANSDARRLAKLSERSLALGQFDQARKLADQAVRIDPDNAEAEVLRGAAAKAKRVAAGPDALRLARQPERAGADDGELIDEVERSARRGAQASDGELLDELERRDRVREAFLQREVANALSRARAAMAYDPAAAKAELTVELDKVNQAPGLSPAVRSQLVEKLDNALRSADREFAIKEDQQQRLAQREAEGEARERMLRELYLQEEKVDQLMARFSALMDEERYRDAEALADIAEELMGARPGLRGAELTARMVGYTADMNAVRDLRHKGVIDAMYQIELSHIPTPDEPPILYPDPEVWQLLTERRKKYKSVDLAQNNENEDRILAALTDKTVLDFDEQPLTEAIEYLKERHGIEIQLDVKALEEEGVGTETPVTRHISNITLRSALRLMLGEMDLTYIVKNEVLLITTKAEAEALLSTRVYPVGDLVIPVPGMMGGRGMGGRGMMNVPPEPRSVKVSSRPAGDFTFRAFAVSDELKLSGKGSKPKAAKRPSGRPAAKQPANQPEAAPGFAAPGMPPAAKRPKAPKVDPIRLDLREGEDADVAWNDYFAGHKGEQAPAGAVVRETVRDLFRQKKFAEVIGLVYAALRHQQGQPWMYEALGLALQADQRTPEEIERVLMSALDFTNNPIDMMYLAQYMSGIGLKRRALQLFRQVSEMDTTAPEPFAHGLRLAQEIDDLDGIEWATVGILGQAWPRRLNHIWEAGFQAAEATLDRLRTENRKQEADAYKKALDEAMVRDCVVVASWTGDADIDLRVEEPPGTICWFRNPRTTSGGLMLGDSVSKSKKEDRNAQGAQEVYVCPQGFDGTYRVQLRRVWGKTTGNKVTLDITWHWWSNKERTQRKQIELDGDEAVAVFELKDGRRTQPLEEPQVANAVADQLAIRQQVNRQIGAVEDPRIGGSLANSRRTRPGQLKRGVDPLNPWVMRGGAGYQPVVISLPKGASMLAGPAVISADRRYVRITSFPLFSGVTQVNTFNYVTGASGSSGGAGGGGFGAGGGAGGLGGF